jgi:hypothetical protein
LSVPLEEGTWVVGFRDMNAPGELVEYVRRGESVDNWTEMFSERTLPDLQKTSTPGDSFADYKKTIKENCPDAKWTLIEDSSADVVYQMTPGTCEESRPAYEIGRFMSGGRALYQLLWQSKSQTVDQKQKDAWISTLTSSEVAPY